MKVILSFIAGVIFTLVVQYSGRAPEWMQAERNRIEAEIKVMEKRLNALAQMEMSKKYKKQ
jgi:hypothetical protein